MTDFGVLAEKALQDEMLTREEALGVLATPDERLLELLNAAFRVRKRHFGRTVRLQMLMNAKSGACQEDCHYCSQSAVSTADIHQYGLLPKAQMVEGARRVAELEWDPDEELEVLTRPVDEVYALVRNGEITHSLVLNALLLFQPHWDRLRAV